MDQYYIEYVSNYCNISKSKLRYYEKKNILKNIERDSNNKRLYTKDDIEMIKFIKCLSHLNMPLKEIEKNTNMLYQNKTDVKTILEAHLAFLNEQKNLINTHIHLIEQELAKAITR
ncbi:MerR family transcriptional regulator [Staphylococcus sp. 17KM0847]|uniref:helix-turn-helix domain-containing protein n=1 Tax=Staphylococcus sp. 17KM0847 TaxID=2583989 RepID=UPI0015DC4DBB|nr:MerR family transcriptional regulator [Staphylococcus sp. 17KM0847]QLK85243.1 MerR family transcriptional regulator [Staphylococcus sp. 17KM0847]